MISRPVAAGIVASLLALTGCGLPSSEALSGSPTTTAVLPAEPAVAVAPSPAPAAPTTTPAAPTTTEPTLSAAAAVAPSPLVAALRALWPKSPARSCLMVADGARVVFERNPDLPVVPASTMKLLTATAVLARIDAETRLTTQVRTSAAPDAGGVVDGDLWLVGGGDPVLGTAAWRRSFRRQPRLVTPIELLADRVAAAGVRHVTGRVIGDDSRYERVRYLPSWPARYVTGNETGPLSALAVNDGFRQVHPEGPFADPAAGAAGVLNELLRQRGVRVEGRPASGVAPPTSVTVAILDSPTIRELVNQMLLDSDNDTAELLLRELGLRVLGQGTTDAGRRVVVDTLRRMGLPMAGSRVVDASGLDPGNRVTCRLLTRLLLDAPTAAYVDRGLPVAAQTGTLYRRFLATPVAGRLRAKTGSIRQVAALAGHARSATGSRLTFAYVQNGTGSGQGVPLQHELGHHLVLSPQG